MIEIELDPKAGIFYNLEKIYKKIKELKKKAENLKNQIYENEKKLKQIEIEVEIEKKVLERKLTKKWYEKFRWFFTSNNFLFIAGKDAITNEILINKYLEKNDLVFHADIHGSPFGILKNGINAKEEDILESAKFVASYSKAWKMKLRVLDVYYIFPNQISKKTPSGEYLKKGSFMIYGKRNYIRTNLELAIGFEEELIPGVPESVMKKTKNYVVLIPGDIKPLEIAKKISKILNYPIIDDIIKLIPGSSELK
ncbi:MAG: DUF814 domain-containing protein [Nanopusillaceae archaeon]